MIMLLNELKENDKSVGYTYFDLDRYIVGKVRKADIRSKDIWGSKEDDKLFGFKNLPIINMDKDKNKIVNPKIIVVGRIELDKNKYLYVVSYGSYVLRIQNERMFFAMKEYHKLINVNVDETFQFIRSNKASIPDINVLLLRKRVQENKLSVIVDSKDELNSFFKVLEKGYRKEADDILKEKEKLKEERPKLSLNSQHKILQQVHLENKFFIKGCLDGNLSKNELINNGYSFVERKRLMSEVQYNLDMALNDIKKQIDNFVVVFCDDNDCKGILLVLKEKFKNVTQLSHDSIINMMKINYFFMENRQGKDKFKNEPCVYCVPMKNLNATFLLYNDKGTGGFTSLSLPNATYISVNDTPNYNLDFLWRSQHEYTHYLSSSNEAIGLMRDDFIDKELENVLRVFNEGITDILAGYFVYNICKEKYSKGEVLKDNQGKVIPLVEIEKSLSPYLTSMTSLKPVDSMNESEINKSLGDVYRGNVGYKYNNLFVFYFLHKIGLKEVLDLYMNNDYQGFIKLCEEKLKLIWGDLYDFLKIKNNAYIENKEYKILLNVLKG